MNQQPPTLRQIARDSFFPSQAFAPFRASGEFTDAVVILLAEEDEDFSHAPQQRLHRVVLSSVSTTFRFVFASLAREAPRDRTDILRFKVDPALFNLWIELVYEGQILIDESKVSDFFRLYRNLGTSLTEQIDDEAYSDKRRRPRNLGNGLVYRDSGIIEPALPEPATPREGHEVVIVLESEVSEGVQAPKPSLPLPVLSTTGETPDLVRKLKEETDRKDRTPQPTHVVDNWKKEDRELGARPRVRFYQEHPRAPIQFLQPSKLKEEATPSDQEWLQALLKPKPTEEEEDANKSQTDADDSPKLVIDEAPKPDEPNDVDDDDSQEQSDETIIDVDESNYVSPKGEKSKKKQKITFNLKQKEGSDYSTPSPLPLGAKKKPLSEVQAPGAITKLRAGLHLISLERELEEEQGRDWETLRQKLSELLKGTPFEHQRTIIEAYDQGFEDGRHHEAELRDSQAEERMSTGSDSHHWPVNEASECEWPSLWSGHKEWLHLNLKHPGLQLPEGWVWFREGAGPRNHPCTCTIDHVGKATGIREFCTSQQEDLKLLPDHLIHEGDGYKRPQYPTPPHLLELLRFNRKQILPKFRYAGFLNFKDYSVRPAERKKGKKAGGKPV